MSVEASEVFLASPFAALAVGDRVTTPRRVVSAREIDQFALLSGDQHPVHLDDEFASASVFGERVAHGLLVLSMAVGSISFDPRRLVALRRIRDAVFKRPVPVGSDISVALEIERLRPFQAGLGQVDCRLTVTDSEGRVAVRALVEVLWASDDGEGGA